MSPHDRAAAAVKFGEGVATVALLALTMLALGYLALLGDDIQAWRTERLALPAHEIRHEHQARESRCDWQCIERIPTGPESWPNQPVSEGANQ